MTVWAPLDPLTRKRRQLSRRSTAAGMRRGELCGLRWRDLDLEAGQVTVNQRVSDLPSGMTILPGTKTKKKRRLALDRVTVTILAKQHVRASERCEALGVELTREVYVVWSQDADHRSPWRPHRVTDAFRAVSRAEGLGTVRLQDLRHFSATQMLGAGVDPRTAAGRLGHDASVLLRIYGHMIPARDREAAEILGRLMSGDGDVPRRFGPGELNAFLNAGAGPPTPDDETARWDRSAGHRRGPSSNGRATLV